MEPISAMQICFSSLKGASLRGSDLEALLDGTDLRQADLSGSLISEGALERSHWLKPLALTKAPQRSITTQRRGG